MTIKYRGCSTMNTSMSVREKHEGAAFKMCSEILLCREEFGQKDGELTYSLKDSVKEIMAMLYIRNVWSDYYRSMRELHFHAPATDTLKPWFVFWKAVLRLQLHDIRKPYLHELVEHHENKPDPPTPPSSREFYLVESGLATGNHRQTGRGLSQLGQSTRVENMA